MENMPRWYQDSKSRLTAGDRVGAFRILVAAGKRGNLEAAATLARWMWPEEPDEHCVAILEEVERRASKRSWRTHFALHLAYSIGVGMGTRGSEEVQRRAFECLKVAAVASKDSRMFLSVGLHYWKGLNSVAPDPQNALFWLEAAASSGESEAVAAHKLFVATTEKESGANAA